MNQLPRLQSLLQGLSTLDLAFSCKFLSHQGTFSSSAFQSPRLIGPCAQPLRDAIAFFPLPSYSVDPGLTLLHSQAGRFGNVNSLQDTVPWFFAALEQDQLLRGPCLHLAPPLGLTLASPPFPEWAGLPSSPGLSTLSSLRCLSPCFSQPGSG